MPNKNQYEARFHVLKENLNYLGGKIRRMSHGPGKQGSTFEKNLLERKCGLLRRSHQMQTENMERFFWEKVALNNFKLSLVFYTFSIYRF